MSDSKDLAAKLWMLRKQTKEAMPDEFAYEKAVHPYRQKLIEQAEGQVEPEDGDSIQPAYIRAYVAAMYVSRMVGDEAGEILYGCALTDLLEWAMPGESGMTPGSG